MKAAILLVLLVSACVAAAQPTLWSPTVGGNGHSYEVRTEPAPLPWETARQAAEDAGGYLVTITSPAENDFLKSLILPDGAHIGKRHADLTITHKSVPIETRVRYQSGGKDRAT